MRYHIYREVAGDLAGSSELVARAVVEFIRAMVDEGAVDLDDVMMPEECFWAVQDVAPRPDALALVACPQAHFHNYFWLIFIIIFGSFL